MLEYVFDRTSSFRFNQNRNKAEYRNNRNNRQKQCQDPDHLITL